MYRIFTVIDCLRRCPRHRVRRRCQFPVHLSFRTILGQLFRRCSWRHPPHLDQLGAVLPLRRHFRGGLCEQRDEIL